MKKKNKGKRHAKRRSGPRNTLLKQMRYFKHKLVGLVPVQLGGTNGTQSNVTFSRYDFQGLIANVIGINTPSRWQQVYKNYEQFAVTGFKLRYIPTNASPIVQNGAIQPNQQYSTERVMSFEDIDTYNIAAYTDAQAVTLESFKCYGTKAQWKLFRNNKPLAAVQSAKWTDTAASTVISNGLPQAGVCVRTHGSPGWAEPNLQATTVAWIKYTYYVTFKGQALGQ